MRDHRDPYEATDDRREPGAGQSRYRDEYDDIAGDRYDSRAERDGYAADRYDSDYEEGEDPVTFVNVIDMDIPFFQLVWLIFKIMLAAIVSAGIIYLLGMLLHWVLSLPQVQQILPDGASWLSGIFNR